MPTAQINGHTMYFEVHGDEDAPLALCMGGWGTFCHGKSTDAPRYLMENYRVVLFDYRGLGESVDDDATPSMQLYAADVAGLLDHLSWQQVHIVGMVGMGACVAQELAISRPDLVRSLVMTGTWAWADPILSDQLCQMRDVHQDMGFPAFQMLAASYSFEGAFYNRNRERLLGPSGTWSDLVGRFQAHANFVEASLTHDVRDRIGAVTAPALVLHAGKDPITTERHTRELEELMSTCEGVSWPEATHVLAGRELRSRFDDLLRGFLEKH